MLRGHGGTGTIQIVGGNANATSILEDGFSNFLKG